MNYRDYITIEPNKRSGKPCSTSDLAMSLVRALLGNIYPQLRSASIELSNGSNVIRIRFEYDGDPQEEAREACSLAVSEVIADFWAGHEFDVQHAAVPVGIELCPLEILVFRRGEIENT